MEATQTQKLLLRALRQNVEFGLNKNKQSEVDKNLLMQHLFY